MVSKEKILVQFENIQERYFIDDGKPMIVEYVLNSEFEPSTKDWLGIFPKGWRKLEQQLLAEWALTRYSKENKYRRIIDFDLSYLSLKMNCFNADYQIVYVSRYMQVIGRSSYFRLQRKLNDVHSHGDNAGVFDGTGTALISSNLSPTSSKIPSLRPCSPASSIIQPVNCRGIGYPLVRPYRSECVLPLPAREYFSPCPFCPEHVHQRHMKDEQIKDLAEINRQLRKKLVDLEHRLELSLAAQKRLKLFCFYIRQEKQSYEVFVTDLLKCLRGNSPVCVRDYTKGSEMLVQCVSSDIDNHLVQLTLRHSPLNERYLKAVIGNQEMKIQELSAKLTELTNKLAQFELLTKQRKRDTENEIEDYRNNHHSKNYKEIEMSAEEKNNMINDKEREIEHHNDDDGVIDKPVNGEKRFVDPTVSSERIEDIVEIHMVEEKSEVVICDVNNNYDVTNGDENEDDLTN